MTSTIVGEKPHVTCLMVDADTVRYGGSAFRRVKRCRDMGGEEGTNCGAEVVR